MTEIFLGILAVAALVWLSPLILVASSASWPFIRGLLILSGALAAVYAVYAMANHKETEPLVMALGAVMLAVVLISWVRGRIRAVAAWRAAKSARQE
jgi:hypothetical protein